MKAGVYIHIPFCLTKCGYCNFFSLPYSRSVFAEYFSNLLREIELNKSRFNLIPETVYFGGGTPSLLSSAQINQIIEILEPEANAEITLEINPVQITEDFVQSLAQTKVNRLSLGVQTLKDENLQALGRKHTVASIPHRVQLLRDAGFDNISLDLMYGLPGSSTKDVEIDLERFLTLQPEHISTYLLTIEDDVPFRNWKEFLPTDDNSALQYATICRILEQEGYEHYELSNFCRPGKEGRHNLKYWLGEDFAGMGAGASGFLQGRRYKRPEDFKLWQSAVRKEELIYEVEKETPAQQKADFIIMQLRLMRGLDLSAYRKQFGSDFINDYQTAVSKLTSEGLLRQQNNMLKLTPPAWFISNHVFQEFV
ncbi:MAG TPA: radical SAM family heme chaperone HemW [Candidatus Cloacimonadota bacterium]|nr:radical SAM family heme chaperone HemW [Candidatus Cloacimonadota bacterium]HQL14818.1 radical SAM family heme chaperone HemW [Candidatus Cloacimonadota bacterium]